MFCKECGTEFEDGNYCPKCGVKTKEDMEFIYTPLGTKVPKNPSKRTTIQKIVSSNIFILAIIIIIGITITILVNIINLND